MDKMLEYLKKEKIIDPNADWDKVPFYRAQKSSECEDGYSGRVGIHEVLKVTSSIKELILKASSQDNIEKQARLEGMMTMIEDGIFKAAQGTTTTEEVLRVVSE